MRSDDAFVRILSAIIVGGIFVGLGASVVDLPPDARRGALAMLAWFVVLLPIHEAGHALVARAVGVAITKVSIGYGDILYRGRAFGAPIEIRAFPVQGFVAFDQGAPPNRLQLALVAVAGVGAELLVVLAAQSLRTHATRGLPLGDAIAIAGLGAVGISVLTNLVPRTATPVPGAEGARSNDGMILLRALSRR